MRNISCRLLLWRREGSEPGDLPQQGAGTQVSRQPGRHLTLPHIGRWLLAEASVAAGEQRQFDPLEIINFSLE